MARLIIKSPYLKGGSKKTAAHLDNLVKYIATREGVDKTEIAHELWSSTKKQKSLISQIVREFPDAKNSLEYEDYLNAPNRKNASEFISTTLEHNMHIASDKEKYIDYISNRPRVEKFESHGLFTGGDDPLVLAQVAREVASHEGNVWTPIISIRREDAISFGFESAYAWKAVLNSKALEIAESLKIHPNHFKWYAAFHNESHHPHVHMICYSTNQTEGYLTKQGIRKMKSAIANEIFKQELIPLFSDKTLKRDQLKEQSALALKELTSKMQEGTLQNSKIEELLLHLADRLQYTCGKLQYGYLQPKLKNVVDKIVEELSRDEKIANAYRLWFETKGLIDSIYSNTTLELPPLSKNDDFKAIRNMVIGEAIKIMKGKITFEGEPIIVEQLEYEYYPQKTLLERSSLEGSHISSYRLGKMFLCGEGEIKDIPMALHWLNASAEKGNQYAQYTLGAAYLKGEDLPKDIETAIRFFELAAEQGNVAAVYKLGKLYLTGEEIPKDIPKAMDYLNFIAEKGNQYAQYLLGKLYFTGEYVPKDKDMAKHYFSQSAEQSNIYAKFFLDNIDKTQHPSVMLAATNLLRHIGRVFADTNQSIKPANQQVDRKLLRKLQEKKRAQGHAKDDHVQSMQTF